MSVEMGSKNTSGSDVFKIYETNSFRKCLEQYGNLLVSVENKLRFLRNDPYCGEPLKYELAGLRSIAVKRNFLIIYGICRECKKSTSFVSKCSGYGEKAVVLYAFGPHDDLYKIAKKLRKKQLKK